MLDVFRFESAALVHPDCIGAVKLAQEMLVMSLALGMAIMGYLLFWQSKMSGIEFEHVTEIGPPGRDGNADREKILRRMMSG